MKNHWTNLVHELHQQNIAYVLVTILGKRGSAPRDSGTKMIVTADASYATIGGGQLEFKAIQQARNMLSGLNTEPDSELGSDTGSDQHLEHYPLGPKLGQCCGGSTNILYEHFAARSPHIMLFGAGHVGCALATILGELPVHVQWVDNRPEQFSDVSPYSNIKPIISTNPANEITSMPINGYYLVMTHDHQLDFDLCCAVLKRNDAKFIGLIGSNTKWLRFKKRLSEAGFSEAQIAKIKCPIGLSNVGGKQPMEVAVSISGQVIEHYQLTKAKTANNNHSSLKQLAKQEGIQWKELKSVNAVENSNSDSLRKPAHGITTKDNKISAISKLQEHKPRKNELQENEPEEHMPDNPKDCDTCTACK